MPEENIEIERKFLVKKPPDLTKFQCSSSEKYYLSRGERAEIRITRIGDYCEHERKEIVNGLLRNGIKRQIPEEQFEKFKLNCDRGLFRDNYTTSENPELSIKIYHGDDEGLVRVEVEFKNEEDVRNFVPPDWFGKEMTNTELGRDARLIDLDKEDFIKLLRSLG
ncbi:hypothetical protein COT44_03280 [Candidatus Shapirobacteria bacterium CG08_land_8_20_14_0_20_39_18]|uniref:CYTH domain-containing protein n=1 Tax=Candidatus Shapirobacteria bacterium CG08_land_8_20_14_0_20_39_18 TaxID=1974883 RepID=A0A2M6XCQ4_9BACT|nr:MAG: hypothetical protein COT44_03280 [Candidatus Shapirobacteria bacterium CG08_land_8_20_14_0_20_39_18]PIY65082.1 MAG: hypothetical protein COY91_03390 [Candidatus Shapirobacteria bacterium CG_4_10_14_0_8_um_filter_39_15]